MLDLDLQQKRFGDDVILGPIELALSQGERRAILGPSGIGKTTLLRIISGLDPQFQGRCQRPDGMTLMFQNPTLLEWRTARENLEIFHPNASKSDVNRALEQVGLSQKSAHFPRQLSTGQQRRLALARAFVGEADLVLLDEPFASLDRVLREEMIELTKSLLDQKKATMILVTHDEAEAQALNAALDWLVPSSRGAQLK